MSDNENINTPDDTAEEQCTVAPGFPSAGDKAESRRLRHSFRFCVVTVVVFTGMLWVSEKYMRYDLTESQYIMALTLEPESARAVLRQVVKRDSERREAPAVQYVQALAAREESDLILPTYERAYKLNPDSASIGILYGCALFQAERYEEARERFREAGIQPGQNALPRYLEAAACAMLQAKTGDFSESLSLVAKTNSSDREVKFPQPVWSQVLPAEGYWYEKLRRQIADECCAPMYKFSDLVTEKARKQVSLRQPQYWDSWLDTMQEMGKRFAFSGEPGTVKATAGIYIQLAALEQRAAIRSLDKEPVDELVQRKTKLQHAQNIINEFESRRDIFTRSDMGRQQIPTFLVLKGFAVMLAAFLLSYLAGRISKADRRWRALPHGRMMSYLTVGVVAATLLLLMVMGILQRIEFPLENMPLHMSLLSILWWCMLLCAVGFGLVYPKLRLNAFREQLRHAAEHEGIPERQLRAAVYISYLRRYYGVVTGSFLCAVCAWTLLFRILVELYPWQFKLLATGLAGQEAEVVKHVLEIMLQAV